jgi:hypothetical protein
MQLNNVRKEDEMKQPKRGAPYVGDDVADYTHNNKTHRTQSEAFRDANYANAFEPDAGMSDCKLFMSELAMLVVPLTLFGFFVYWLINALVEVAR